jgi:hypothetical protein
LHPFGDAAAVSGFAYWRGWDIARGVQLLPVNTATSAQGWVLDGWGGLHAFGGAPRVAGGYYTPGSISAVDLAIAV